MITEIYRKKDAPFVNEAKKKIDEAQRNKYAAEIEQLQQMIVDYKALGLGSQVEIVQQRIKGIRKQARKECGINPKQLGYSEITSTEMKIWAVWLPTRYVESQFPIYSFDQIPQEVVEEMRTARTLELFDTLEIRTPETTKVQDPILIGWLDKVPYLIARWGESLRPFEGIKKLVEESWRIKKKAMWLVTPSIMGGFLCLGTCLIFSELGYNYQQLYPCLVLSFLLIVGGVFIRDFKLNPEAFLDKHRLAVV